MTNEELIKKLNEVSALIANPDVLELDRLKIAYVWLDDLKSELLAEIKREIFKEASTTS